MSKIKESLRYYTVLPIVYQFFRLAITILLARILEPKDFGIMGLASIIVFYTNNLTNFGFSTALINKKTINEHEINSIFTINLIVSTLLSLLIIAFAPSIADFFKIPELNHALLALVSIFFLTSYALVALSVLKRKLQFKVISIIELTSGVVQYLLTLFLAWTGFGFWSMIAGLIVGNAVNVALSLRAARWRPRFELQIRALKKMLNYASWTFYEAQLRILENYIDKLVIGRVLGPVNLGYYEKAGGFAMLPVDSLVHKITGVMFSAYSRSQTDQKELLNYLKKTIVLMSILCFPVFAGIGLIADYFVPLLLGDKWIPMIRPLFFLLIAYSFYALVSSTGTFNVAAGSYKKQISARSLCLALLFCSLFLFAKNGLSTVAIVIMMYQVTFFSISASLVAQRLGVNVFHIISWLGPAFLLTIIMGFCVTITRIYWCEDLTIFNMLLLIIVGIASYTFSFFVFNFKITSFLKKEVAFFLFKLKKCCEKKCAV